jgi:hypothetical protein
MSKSVATSFRPGTPAEDWAHREEIFKAWHEQHKSNCPYCVADGEDGSMAEACAEYHLIRLLYAWLTAKGEPMSRNKATEEMIDAYAALKAKLLKCNPSLTDEERLMLWGLAVSKIKRLQDGTEHICEFDKTPECIVCGETL